VDLWQNLSGKLFDLEAKLMKQASATEVQTTTVKRLKQQASGPARVQRMDVLRVWKAVCSFEVNCCGGIG
jgi:hypothetical protein